MVITAQYTKLKPGYKQTEVGVIPEDWDIIELGNIIDYTKGFAFKSDDYQSDGVRIIRVSDTTFDSIKDVNQIFVDRDKAYSYDKWTLKEHDLVLSTVGSKPPMYDSMVGKATMIEKRYDGALLNQNAVLIRSKNRSPFMQILLLNHFRTKRYLKYIEAIFRGNANQASITLNDLFHFQLALPSKDAEQRAIATALSDVDALITSLDKLIAKKRDIKQATMQELLTGKTRLPGFSPELSSAYKQTEVGILPENWKVKKLKDLCISIRDGTHYTPRYVNDGIPFYSVENITANNFTDVKFISLKEHNELIRRCKPEKGDILLTRIGSLGYTKIINWDVNASIYVSLALLKMNSQQILTDYIYEYSKSDQFVKNVEKRSLMNATPIKINMGQIGNIPIPCPPLPEQKAIAAILSDIAAEIVVLEQRRDKTRALKQGMMQELLTGKTRLI